MLSTITGFLLGIVKNLMWVSYAVVEAALFMWVFNYLAPIFPTWGWNFLPVDHLNFWTSLCIFLAVGFVGSWVKSLSPFSISVNSESKSE